MVVECWYVFFFFKQKTAYEMRISDWSSDVCSSDLHFTEGRVGRDIGRVGFGIDLGHRPRERADLHLHQRADDRGDRFGHPVLRDRIVERRDGIVHLAGGRGPRRRERRQGRGGEGEVGPGPTLRADERRGGKEWVCPGGLRG